MAAKNDAAIVIPVFNIGKFFTDNKETKFNSHKGFQLLLDIIGRQRTNKWNFFILL